MAIPTEVYCPKGKLLRPIRGRQLSQNGFGKWTCELRCTEHPNECDIVYEEGHEIPDDIDSPITSRVYDGDCKELKDKEPAFNSPGTFDTSLY